MVQADFDQLCIRLIDNWVLSRPGDQGVPWDELDRDLAKSLGPVARQGLHEGLMVFTAEVADYLRAAVRDVRAGYPPFTKH